MGLDTERGIMFKGGRE